MKEISPRTPQIFKTIAVASALLAGNPHAFARVVDAGPNFSTVICASSTVQASGRNNQGQLGNGTNTDSNTPVTVSGLSNITSVSVGYQYTMYLKNDGTVWATGQNLNGQFGNGTTATTSNVPVQASITNVIRISATQTHSIFLKGDGTAWASGQNNFGQLGDGTTTSSASPVQVAITNVASVTGGLENSFFVKTDGTVWCVGQNSNGQLGIGTTMPHLGEMLQSYFDRKRTYQAALARAINREPDTLRKYKQRHSLQAAILWELSHALKYNFFADLAAALPADFEKASSLSIDEKDAEIADLRNQVAQLQRDKDLLMEMKK